jgi:hypothetical protein
MLSGDVSPMQIENCADDLLQDSFAAANDRKVPLTLHVAQGVLEHLEMLKRHGVTRSNTPETSASWGRPRSSAMRSCQTLTPGSVGGPRTMSGSLLIPAARSLIVRRRSRVMGS